MECPGWDFAPPRRPASLDVILGCVGPGGDCRLARAALVVGQGFSNTRLFSPNGWSPHSSHRPMGGSS